MSYTDIPEDQSRIEKKYIYLKQNKIKKRKSENLVRLGCPTCVSKKKKCIFQNAKKYRNIFTVCPESSKGSKSNYEAENGFFSILIFGHLKLQIW